VAEILASATVRGPAEPPVIDALHETFERLWDDVLTLGPEDRMPFELAVVEVATNAVRHAKAPDDGSVELQVDVEVRPYLLLARLYELGAVPMGELDVPDSMPGPEADSGRGLQMVRQLLSTVSCERQGEANVWTLTRTSGDGGGAP
jgi:serine/threonine-protein kinase RsbW